MSAGWGGKREGAGPKPSGYVPPEGRADYELERAAHEKVKREQREFALAKERGEYIPRAAVRQAASTAMAMFTQAARSIPDNLERAAGISPDVAAAVQTAIDDALTDLAKSFRMMTGDS